MLWKRLKRPRFLLVYPFIWLLFLSAQISETSLRVGIAIIVCGELLRLWANGYVGHEKVNRTQQQRGDPKVGRLITAGPYAFVRHPLYLGTLIIGAGLCLVVLSVWVAVVFLCAFMVVYRRKMAEENGMLRAEYPQAYELYQPAVPAFLPTWHRYPNREGRWSWRGIGASKEWKTVIWVVVLVIVLYFWEESVQQREWLFDERPVFRLILLGVCLALMSADGVIELVLRRRRAARTPAEA